MSGFQSNLFIKKQKTLQHNLCAGVLNPAFEDSGICVNKEEETSGGLFLQK